MSEKNKNNSGRCQWGDKDRENTVYSYFAMSPIREDLEEEILKIMEEHKTKEWWSLEDKINEDLFDRLSFYDQLTCTVGRARVCEDCLDEDEKNYAKYRQISKEGNDPYDMMKVVVPDNYYEDEPDIDGMDTWLKNTKNRVKKMRPNKEK